MSSYNYVILGGAPKAGTTSLFRYLIDHPQVCGTNRKETYFFARDYDFKLACKVGNTSKDFESYFVHSTGQESVRLESTPYTLYQVGAAEKIRNLFPDCRLIFLLRDPVKRMLSDYYMVFSRLANAATPTLEEVIDTQLNQWNKIATNLQQGCYVEYLQPFFKIFGKEQVLVIFHEHLLQKPLETVRKISEYLEINSDFYSDYHFQNYNQTVHLRYTWLNRVIVNLEPMAAELFARLITMPRLYRITRKTADAVKFLVLSLSKDTNHSEDSPDAILRLRKFYEPYNQRLEHELGCPLPWNSE